MTTTRDVRVAIEALVRPSERELSPDVRDGVYDLLKRIKRHDSRPISEVLEMIAVEAIAPPAKAKMDLGKTVAALRAALLDDAAFAETVAVLSSNRAATKPFLAQVYLDLFRRKRGVRTSASRDEIVQLILDERNVLKRHGTLLALTKPESVAAD